MSQLQLPGKAIDVTAITPGSLYDGSVSNVRIDGTNLDSAWSILLCPKPAASKPSEAPPTAVVEVAKSTSASLQMMLTAAPGTAGEYSVYFLNADKVYDSTRTISIASSADTKYVSCAAPANRGEPDANIACSFVPLSYETELEVFGKGVANRFIAVEVIVRNKNSDLEYLLQDLRIGTPDFMLSSYDKRIPQGVSQKQEQFSARAIIVRVTAAAASVLTGVAGFAGSQLLQYTANVYAGPFQTGLQSAIPDLSAAELSRLDNLAFSESSEVIPKNSALAVVGFVPADYLCPAANPSVDLGRHLFGWVMPKRNAFSTYSGADLRNLFVDFTVQVAGTHVQEVNPSGKPTLKTLIPPAASYSLAALQKTGVAVEGSALSAVAKVELVSSDGKTVIPAALKPIAGETSVDPNVAQLVISGGGYPQGDYQIRFILSDGTSVQTDPKITITTP
ncbi:MAG TPA: hypothetical protein VHU89_11865 [Acidobacteriaceae bacterium]|nr:hypothetical protein [Acidobacteriaceae bacterium]